MASSTKRPNVHGVVAAGFLRSRGQCDRASWPVLHIGYARKEVGLSISDIDVSCIQGVAERERQIVEGSQHHSSTNQSRQTPNDVRSELQLLGRCSIDYDERVASLFSTDAAERFEQPAVVHCFICGDEWLEFFLLCRHRRGRDRRVDVATHVIICRYRHFHCSQHTMDRS